MKLKFIGTGNVSSLERSNTSFLVDDKILFDVGSGTVRQLCIFNVDITIIEYVIISHFHNDHILDIVDLLYRRKFNGANKKLSVIGPRGLREYIKYLLTYPNDPDAPDVNTSIEDKFNMEFIEIDTEEISFDDYVLKAFTVKHDPILHCNGYILTNDNSSIAYSGDTELCESLDNLVIGANTVIIECSNTSEKKGHLSYDEVKSIAFDNLNRKFYAVHRGDYKVLEKVDNLSLPDDGEEIEIGD